MIVASPVVSTCTAPAPSDRTHRSSISQDLYNPSIIFLRPTDLNHSQVQGPYPLTSNLIAREEQSEARWLRASRQWTQHPDEYIVLASKFQLGYYSLFGD